MQARRYDPCRLKAYRAILPEDQRIMWKRRSSRATSRNPLWLVTGQQGWSAQLNDAWPHHPIRRLRERSLLPTRRRPQERMHCCSKGRERSESYRAASHWERPLHVRKREDRHHLVLHQKHWGMEESAVLRHKLCLIHLLRNLPHRFKALPAEQWQHMPNADPRSRSQCSQVRSRAKESSSLQSRLESCDPNRPARRLKCFDLRSQMGR